jgi:hypothetical protein
MLARWMSALLTTSLFLAAGSARADRAAVIVQGGDAHFPAAVRNEAIAAVAGELRAALTIALGMARARQAMGPGPWLRVDGDPRGAVVVIDGTDRGVVPFEGRVEPGTRSVVVRLTGYQTEERSVTIPASTDEPVLLEVHLAPTPTSPPSPAIPPEQPRPAQPPTPVDPPTQRPIIGPLVLGVVGVAGVAIAAYGALPEDCDTVSSSAKCLAGERTAPVPTITFAAIGLGALTAAVLWYLLGAQPVQPDRLRPTTAALHSPFALQF